MTTEPLKMGLLFPRGLTWMAGIALTLALAATLAERSSSIRADTASRLFLKQLIARDLPQLATAGSGSSTSLTRLRQWAFENTDWSTPSANLDDDRRNRFYEMDAPELFSAFRNDRGGVLCGGTAYAFMRLCRLYGYDALTLDFGDPSAWTHVVTLVRLNQGGRDVWSIQDPTYDVTYVHRDGTPFDYLDLLRALRDRQDEQVFVKKGKGRSRDYIVAPGDAESMLATLRSDASFELFVGRLPDGALKYRRRYSFDSIGETVGPSVARFLTREGHPAKAIYLFLYPIRISGGWAFDQEQHQVPREVRPRYMMKRARKILGLSGETG